MHIIAISYLYIDIIENLKCIEIAKKIFSNKKLDMMFISNIFHFVCQITLECAMDMEDKRMWIKFVQVLWLCNRSNSNYDMIICVTYQT